jgi:spermidine synthase
METLENKTNKPERKLYSSMLYLSMFVMGGCGLAYEYTFSKLSTDLLGNSSQQWGLIIGIMMFFMGVGSDFQKRIKSSLFNKFIYAELILGLSGSFGPIIVLYSFSQYREHFILIHYFFISLMGLLIGFEIPLLTRVNEQFTSELKNNIGNVLKMDYLGALAGAIAWIFILPKYFTIIESAFVLGFATILVAAITLIYFSDKFKTPKRLHFSVVASFVLIIYGYSQAKSWTIYSEQQLYQDKVVFSKTTKYQHIIITESASKEIACYINGHLQFNSSDEYIYHENLVHPIMSIAPQKNNVLILGGGDGLAVREVLKYKDIESLTLVDLDPVMVDLAANNPYFSKMNQNSLSHGKVKIIRNNTLLIAGTEDLYTASQTSPIVNKAVKVAELNIVSLDAVRFLNQIQGKYNIIIIDFPDPNSVELSKLYSKQFYQLLRTKLTPHGIMVQQSSSSLHAKEAFLCIGRTMDSSGLVSIPIHDNVPSFGEWGWWIAARDDHYSKEKLKKMLNSIKTLPGELRYLTPELIHASLVFGKDQLYTDHTEINTLSNTKVYDYYLKAWQDSF